MHAFETTFYTLLTSALGPLASVGNYPWKYFVWQGLWSQKVLVYETLLKAKLEALIGG